MNYKPISKLSPHFLLSIALIALPLLLFGCSNGSDGAPGTSSGTLTGSVIDTFNNKVANVTVTPSPAVDSLPGGRVTTAADGTYSMTLPTGSYTLTFANAAYVTQTLSVSVVATQTKANANDHAGTEGGGGRDRDGAGYLPRHGLRHPDGDPRSPGSRARRENRHLPVDGFGR